MLRWLTPRQAVQAVTDLDPRTLAHEGIRGVILDMDNTIVGWQEITPSVAMREWVAALDAAGVRGCIVSNNVGPRARQVGGILHLPVVGWALKPVPFGFRRAMRLMSTTARETALIGDQLFTDVLGGNLLGVRTILVEPISPREFPTTMLIRRLERLVRATVLKRVPPPASSDSSPPDAA